MGKAVAQDKRLNAAQAALREALKAIDRANAREYPPHKAACLAAAKAHAEAAARLLS